MLAMLASFRRTGGLFPCLIVCAALAWPALAAAQSPAATPPTPAAPTAAPTAAPPTASPTAAAAAAPPTAAAPTATAQPAPPAAEPPPTQQPAAAGELALVPPQPAPPPVAPIAEEREPTIELVTMGVGSRIWERHGHIVLCVRYPDPRRDLCYNYGIGDFRHPLGMGWGFFRGTNSFWAGADTPSTMLYIYRDTDRTIWSQPLPLTSEQKKQVIAKLELDILDANRYYSYDHFWDNCTTRVRDILDEATGGALSSMKQPTDDRTFRDLAREGFLGMRIPLLITDLAMGRATDRVPSYYERMFLPEYMREAATKLWNVEPRVLYQRKGPPPLKEGPSGRGWLALIMLILTLPVLITQAAGRFRRPALAVALVPQFLIGTIFWILAIISPLPYVHINETCLIFLPLDLLMLVLPAALARQYARLRTVTLVVIAALLLIGVLKQPLWSVILGPLVPALAVGFWPRRPAPEATSPVGKLAASG